MYARETSKVSRACFYLLRFTTFHQNSSKKQVPSTKSVKKLDVFWVKMHFVEKKLRLCLHVSITLLMQNNNSCVILSSAKDPALGLCQKQSARFFALLRMTH